MKNVFFGSQSGRRATYRPARAKVWGQTTSDKKVSIVPPRWALKGLIISGVVGSFSWLLFFSPAFTVSQIDIKGHVSPSTEAIIDRLRGQNIFLLGNHSTEAELLKQEPTLKTIHIVRGIPHFIRVEVIERIPYANWATNGQWFALDQEGVAFKLLTEPKGLQVVDETNLPLELGRKIVSREFLKFLELIQKNLPAAAGLQLKTVLVGETTFSIRAVTETGPEIFFATNEPVDRQLNALSRIWAQKKMDIKQYIDVRIAGSVYYQ